MNNFIDNYNMEQDTDVVVDIASQLNFAHNTGNTALAGRLCSELYNEVGPRRQGGRSLLNLSSTDCQCVGLAFAIIALCYDFGDDDINSVAAENAFYCLGRNLIETENTFVAPAIFTILYRRPNLMKSKLITSWCHMAEKEIGMPIGMILGGNPYLDPRLSDFRQQAFDFKDNIMYFVLNKFFDVKSMEFTIPTDLYNFLPSKSIVGSFLSRIKENQSYGKENFMNNCEEHFVSVYKQCENTLKKF